MRERLSFNRTQLKAVFKDFESIKEFERLISLVDSLIPSTVADIETTVEIANNKAQVALELVKILADLLETQLSLPPPIANNSIRTDYIDLPEDGPHVTLPRRLQWNKDDGTLDVGLYDGVVLQCGQEIHVYAKNDEGAIIRNGRAVMISGAVGASGKLKVKYAVSNGSIDENYMLGIATQDIAINAFGYITVFGLIRGFDTSGGTKTVPEVWADGDILYFDAVYPGELTKVEPIAPALDLPVAMVVKASSGNAGSIAVRMKSGERINSLHDVSSLSPIDLALLQYNTSLNRWEDNAEPWVDIDFPIIVRTTGVGIPSLVAINGNITMPQWAVNDANICESQELIHAWKEGSEVFWHIHLTTNGLDVTNRYVKFEVEYGYADVNGAWTFPAVLTTSDLLIPANTADKTMLILNLGSFTPAVHIGGHVVARLKRIVAGSTAPTNNPWIPMLQLHVKTNTIGSRNMGTK